MPVQIAPVYKCDGCEIVALEPFNWHFLTQPTRCYCLPCWKSKGMLGDKCPRCDSKPVFDVMCNHPWHEVERR